MSDFGKIYSNGNKENPLSAVYWQGLFYKINCLLFRGIYIALEFL